MPFTVGLVRDGTELAQILALQRQNLPANIGGDEAREQGFVTVEHTLATLEAMHRFAPSVVARSGDRLAGYALAMVREARPLLPILEPMFVQLDALTWRGRPLATTAYYVMGQVCIAKEYRGQGVFDALYQGHRAHYADRYDVLVTEVAERNQRSMRAHARVGFETMHRYADAIDTWVIIGWSWRG